MVDVTSTRTRFPLSEPSLKDLKSRLRKILPQVGSVHVTEAIATAMGFPSHRVLRYAMKKPGYEASFDVAKFENRLGEVGHHIHGLDPRKVFGHEAAVSTPALFEPSWPVSSSMGIHLIASGLLAGPERAVQAVILEEARLDLEIKDNGRFHFLSYGQGRAEYVSLIKEPSGFRREVVFNVSRDTPDGMEALAAAHRDPDVFHVFPDVSSPELAKFAVTLARVGWRSLFGIRASNGEEALRKLIELGVDALDVADGRIFSHLDVMGQLSPSALLVESFRAGTMPLSKARIAPRDQRTVPAGERELLETAHVTAARLMAEHDVDKKDWSGWLVDSGYLEEMSGSVWGERALDALRDYIEERDAHARSGSKRPWRR